jgi:hypothetical protein
LQQYFVFVVVKGSFHDNKRRVLSRVEVTGMFLGIKIADWLVNVARRHELKLTHAHVASTNSI